MDEYKLYVEDMGGKLIDKDGFEEDSTWLSSDTSRSQSV